MSAAAVTKLVDYFLRDGATARFGPYEPIAGPDGPLVPEELLPGILYRLQMQDGAGPGDGDAVYSERVDVQVFLGIGELGGLMWEQDIRALLRMAGSVHPALPEVRDGGYLAESETSAAGVEAGGMAFVVTRGARLTAGLDTVAEFRRDQPGAFKQFRSLAESLAVLHHLGLAHRNLSPAAIDIYPGPVLRLARFELSALVADLFRSTVDSESDTASLREFFLRHSG